MTERLHARSTSGWLLAGQATVLAALIAAVFAAVLKGLALEWASSPDSSYGLLLAAVAAAIAWRRRHAFRAAAAHPNRQSAGGLALLILGLLAYLVGTLGADVFITRCSLVFVVSGLTWFLAGGAAARVMAAPLVFLIIAIPLPALVVNAITLPLQLVASRLAEQILVGAGIPVFRDGNVLELRSTTLEVAQACSGLRSLIALSAVACLVAWATERGWTRRAIVVAAAVPIAVALNGVRVAATGMACEMWGRQMATGAWHELAGWITYAAAIGAILTVQRLLRLLRVRRPRHRTHTPEWATL